MSLLPLELQFDVLWIVLRLFGLLFVDRWERSDSRGRKIGSHVLDLNGKWSVGPSERAVNSS